MGFIYMIAPPLSSITSSVVSGYLASVSGTLRPGMLIAAIIQVTSPILYGAAVKISKVLRS